MIVVPLNRSEVRCTEVDRSDMAIDWTRRMMEVGHSLEEVVVLVNAKSVMEDETCDEAENKVIDHAGLSGVMIPYFIDRHPPLTPSKPGISPLFDVLPTSAVQ
ncbi:uncharacterized protein BT62DRAFT_1011102 [Guyanagaster necrorhizus]|uniref:Uncharacterized protein n=1 Tax=Guyanagaster necrorhizus TaxID=856835 RepID=A0A9P7VJF7_9AGAR|nr:uncharacterized protein BT62DRAFT_1011102 [Guyanagaster necrorhizus MCA 3950]KAG7441804.1 hypothetical protein BT62DRAFT_1011102 [Guyanagaster necrorhizus MCA 3950]